MLTPPASWRSVHLGVDRTPRLEFRGTRRRGKIRIAAGHVVSAYLSSRHRPARARGAARGHAGNRQHRAGGGAIHRAGAVRPYHRCAIRRASRRHLAGRARARAAHRRMGRLRLVHHHRRRAGGMVRRPARSPPAQSCAGRFLRARPATAAGLPRRRAFGPAAQDHADRHGYAVVAVGVVLPRAFRRVRLHRRSAADVAGAELAAGAAVACALRRLHGADRPGHAPSRRHAARGRAALFRSRRERRRHARQRRRGAEFCQHRARSIGAQGAGELAVAGANAGACRGGRSLPCSRAPPPR